MSLDDELTFVDGIGRHFARQNGLPPMTGRVIGWLLICDPAQQTIAEMSEALRVSRSAVAAAITQLEEWSWIQRSRAAGERVDRINLDPTIWLRLLDKSEEYRALGAIAQRGLDLLHEASDARRARLAEAAAFAEFITERMPTIATEWQVRRDELRASGTLPT
ncbi:MarR family transcriptional regulator [Nocardia sp. NEAU-G5]|uniref:MarR family transcriptional regulator n=1 Tax=Nocardia albiluteola TaxID=2842303 RepID=A0ABS6BFA8_9NOCA|nr:MarR family transcriptional regulator [Nocardia albiluteola]MBU3068125.1 MarR family transcriptional regulator [Nocardia albiluteola]